MRFSRYPLITGGPWLLLLLTFFVLPIAGLLLLSLSPGNGSAAVFPTLDNYRGILDLASGRPQVLARTLGVALGVVLLATLIALPVAYYLAKGVRSTRLQALVLMLVTVTFLVGPLIRTVSWRGILGVKGLINTALTNSGLLDAPIMALLYGRPAVIAAMTYNSFPFMLFTLFLAMRTIDDRYLVAARDLGASASATFWRIVMPLAAPGLCVGAVLVFVPTLSTVLEPEMLGGTSGRLTTTEIRDQFFHALNWPLGSALTVLLIVAGGLAVGLLAALLALFARACGRVGLSLGSGGGR